MKELRSIRVICILIACVFGGLQTIVGAVENGRFTVVIDAGHGGVDPGSIGKTTKEKDVNLSMALALGAQIARNCPDVNIVYTRTRDVFVPLQDRADIVNKNKADLFISFHANASTNPRAYGFESFVLGTDKMDANLDVAMRENSVILLEDNYKVTYQGFDPNNVDSYIMFELIQDEYMDKSIRFASQVQQQVVTDLKRSDRGVRQAAFLVLLKSACPAILIETGFVTNPEEEKYLMGSGVDQITQSVFKAFKSYYVANPHSVVVNNSTQPASTASTSPRVTPTETVGAVPRVENVTYFSVQIFATSAPIPSGDPAFKELTGYSCKKIDGLYKYVYGQYVTYEEAKKQSALLKDRFPDCFVVKLNK